jgi:beta-galactosidase
LFPETSIGWYRKTFNIARSDSSNRFVLRFDGIYRNSKVWVNGFYLGTNESGYIGISYDISDYLFFDKPNLVTVRVDATQYEGWFYEGAGIYRHVWLEQYHPLHFAEGGVFVHSEVRQNAATVNLEMTIQNEHFKKENASVSFYVSDRNGKKLASSIQRPISISAFGEATLEQSAFLPKPHLWSVEDPYLYRVVALIRSGGKIIDSVTTRLGVRTITINSTQGLLVNGKPVKIYGANCHQDHAGVGSALPDYLQYYRIRLLKEMGVNAYRTSHNPPTPELLDACDSLGMLVLDENRLLNSSPEYIDQLERLIRRDRNHPSVFMWSIGNEEFAVQWNPNGRRVAQAMIRKQKELDPTRTCTYASDLANVFPGVNEVIPVRGFNYRVAAMEPYHKDHPTQPIVGTEMGSTVSTRGIFVRDSVIGYVPDQDISYPWWANTAEQWWSVVADQPWNMGGFIWTGFDYRGEPTPFQWPNINSHFGILDMCGFPKNIYYYYQSWWTTKDVVHISPHWNWNGRQGQDIDVWVNSNMETVELFLNGKSLGKKAMPRNGHLNWLVPYAAGKLEAVGEKAGRKATFAVETTGDPVEIVLTSDQKNIRADGRDATVINVTARDSEGREVPTANLLVNFSLTGDARIIGVGNGDPSSHEADQYPEGKAWQRSLFNGKCQVIVQAGRKTGAFKLTATASGMKAGGAEVGLR